MSTPITNLVKRWNRGTIDHDKVLIVYDSSDTGDSTGTTQEQIANAYQAAWGLALSPRGYDLSPVNAFNASNAWSVWMSDLADYVIANDIEAICAPTSFGKATAGIQGGIGIQGNGGTVSAINALGAIKAIKEIVDEFSATELDNSSVADAMDILIDMAPTELVFTGGVLVTNDIINSGDHFSGGYSMTSPNAQSKYSGMAGVGAGGINDDVLAIDEVSYSGVNFSSYLNATAHALPAQEKWTAESCYPIDDHARVRSLFYLPCWRIGFYPDMPSGQTATPGFTAADCQAMVARSKSAKKPLAEHLSKNVFTTANTRKGSQNARNIPVSSFCVFVAMCSDLGFGSAFGYYKGHDTAADLDQVGSDSGLSKYTQVEADLFREDGAPAGSGDTYRGYSSDAIKLFTQNGNTFPFSNNLLVWSNFIHNSSYTIMDEVYASGSNQAIGLASGAIGADSTSFSNGHAAGFILNGGSAFYGSLTEPNEAEHVNNGAAFFTKLLRGATAAEAALGLNGRQLFFQELMGDGLAQPFYLQSTVNDMLVHRAQEPIYYNRTSNNRRGRGYGRFGTEWMGTDYRVEIPDANGVTQVVIAGYEENYVAKSSLEEFSIIIDQTGSPAIDATTTPNWPSWLVATFECIAGTYTFDGDTVWDSKTILTASNGRKYAVFTTDTGAHYFQQQLDPATTGVEAWAETVGATHDAADEGVTYTISGTPTDPGTDVKVAYNDTAKQGPFLVDLTAANNISVEFPSVCMGGSALTTFMTSISDSIVITDPVTVTYSNTNIASSGGGGGVVSSVIQPLVE